jgi:hypothetical protein
LKTQAEFDQELNRLGFLLPGLRAAGYPVAQMIGFSIIVIIIASVITTGVTKWYIGDLPAGFEWANLFERIFQAPQDEFGLVMWSWKTASFHFSAMLSAIVARQSFIAKRQWFDLQRQQRHRPVFQYVWPSLLGTFTGWVVLSVIIFGDFYGGEAPHNDAYYTATFAMRGALQWAPLALILSTIVLYIADSDIRSHTPLKITGRALFAGVVTGLAGLAIFSIIGPVLVLDKGALEGLTDTYRKIDVIQENTRGFGFLTAAYITLFDFMLCVVVGFVERMRQSALNFGDQLMQVNNSHGRQFFFCLKSDGAATAFPSDSKEFTEENVLCGGQWKQVPEGTVVRWNRQTFENDGAWGDLGIVTLESGSVIYEGYFGNRPIAPGTAEFFGSVETVRPLETTESIETVESVKTIESGQNTGG